MTFILFALVFSICLFGYVTVGSVKITLVTTLLALLFSFYKKLSMQVVINKLMLFYILLLLFFIIIDCFINEQFMFRYIKANIYVFVFSIIFFNLNRETIFKSARFFVFIVCLSLLIATLQKLGFEQFWKLRELFGFGGDDMVQYQIQNKQKAPGLAFYSVQLSYQVSATLLAIIYLYTNGIYNERNFLFISIFLLINSAIIGIISSFLCIFSFLVVYFFCIRHPNKFKVYQLIFSIIFLVSIYYTEIGSRLLNIDSSILSRVVFLYIGIHVLLGNPIGVAKSDLKSEKIKALEQIEPSNLIGFADYILNTAFHNSFINIAVDLGFFSLLLSVIFYGCLLRFNPIRTGNSAKKYNKLYKLFFLSYLFQICSHNASIFYGDLYVGLILIMILVTKSPKIDRN